ncbi:MAG: hypothetical protein IJS84_00305 [Spirochaetales bacterium]|nr:hypothetical protein [Spirochaetales bacterium]
MKNRKLLGNILLLITTAIWGTAFAVLGGTLILGEKMTGREAIGCLVMFIAVILAQIPSRKK